jgi:hypothetical protein
MLRDAPLIEGLQKAWLHSEQESGGPEQDPEGVRPAMSKFPRRFPLDAIAENEEGTAAAKGRLAENNTGIIASPAAWMRSARPHHPKRVNLSQACARRVYRSRGFSEIQGNGLLEPLPQH